MTYSRIAFLNDGPESQKVLKLIDDDGPEAAVLYLSDWDNGDAGEEFDEPASGDSDDVFEDEHYRLTWCHRLGYVGLEGIIP